MKAINVDDWFKGRNDLEEIGDGVIEQLAKNLARLQDVDIAMTPLVDLLTGYTKYRILQFKIDKANEILEEILVVSDWEHKGRFRPVKGTTTQDVYKTIVKLNELLETPRKINYELLKEDK